MMLFTLTGRLAADPEQRTYGADNTPMARLRVASNQPGAERTDFFDVAVFGDTALEVLAEAHKGDKVQLHGNARQGTWTTDDGDTRQRVNLTARRVELTTLQRPAPTVAAAPTLTVVATPSR